MDEKKTNAAIILTPLHEQSAGLSQALVSVFFA